MIIFLPNYFTKEDARGKMIGLVNEGNWKELTCKVFFMRFVLLCLNKT